jgi:hypothetical protein
MNATQGRMDANTKTMKEMMNEMKDKTKEDMNAYRKTDREEMKQERRAGQEHSKEIMVNTVCFFSRETGEMAERDAGLPRSEQDHEFQTKS